MQSFVILLSSMPHELVDEDRFGNAFVVCGEYCGRVSFDFDLDCFHFDAWRGFDGNGVVEVDVYEFEFGFEGELVVEIDRVRFELDGEVGVLYFGAWFIKQCVF